MVLTNVIVFLEKQNLLFLKYISNTSEMLIIKTQFKRFIIMLLTTDPKNNIKYIYCFL